MRAAGLRLGALAPGAALALGLLAACGETGAREAESQVERRDSAGVEIVTSRGPAWTEAEAWRLGAEPTLDIGAVEGPPEEQLFEVHDALRLSDGRIAVANGGTAELRLYDSAGRHQRSVGGEGEGPGEFRSLTSIARGTADSLFAWDVGTQRISIFTGAGEFVRTVTLEAPGEEARPYWEGRLAGGTHLARVRRLTFDPADISVGQRRDSVLYLAYGPEGLPRDTVAWLPGHPRYLDQRGGRFVVFRVPFAPGAMVATARNRVLAGTGASYEVRVLDPQGGWRRILRLRRERPPLSRAMLEEAVAGFEPGDWRNTLTEALEKMELPERVAAFDRLTADAGGNVWVRVVRRPDWLRAEQRPERTGSRWLVFGASGGFLGEVTMPPRFTPYEIGSDYVLGRWEDELEVEHVRVYPLLKPEGGA